MAMSNGNTGTLSVCCQILQQSAAVDPDCASGILPIMQLDTMNIWESRIWMLYKDVCNCDLPKMLAVLRAWQLGQLAGATTTAINHAIDNCGDGLDLDAIMTAVKKRLPRFNANNGAEVQQ